MNSKRRFIIPLILAAFLSSACAKSFTQEEAAKIRTSIVEKAKTFLGKPYKTGAVGPNAFDCSGLVFSVYKDIAGISLPRSVKTMYTAVKIIPLDQIEAGDLVFFKTTGDDTISHVGIYISDGNFIHAASAGSKTGVIISNLNEKYYKNCYAAVGKPITSAGTKTQQLSWQSSPDLDADSQNQEHSFLKHLAFDGGAFFDWSLFAPDRFDPNARGFTIDTGARFTQWAIQPGIGISFRWIHQTNCFQIPLTLSISYKDIFKIYAGGVLTIGWPVNRTYDDPLEAPFFPGVFGISFQTPYLKIGKVLVALVQDFTYTHYIRQDKSNLNFQNGAGAGLSAHTGIRVTIPMKNLLK